MASVTVNLRGMSQVPCLYNGQTTSLWVLSSTLVAKTRFLVDCKYNPMTLYELILPGPTIGLPCVRGYWPHHY